MVDVSNGWKELTNGTLLPQTHIAIVCTATEPGLQQDATVSGNYPEDFSDTSNNGESAAYATLDYGAWGLDGTYSYLDETIENTGYVDKNCSQIDCYFDVNPYPTIIIDFSERREALIPGMTVVWSDTFQGWAVDFLVTAYNGNRKVSQKVVRNNTSVSSEIWFDLSNYTRITIEVVKWSHPYQRLRCSHVDLSLQLVYTKTDLMGFDHTQSVDVLSATLPKSEVTFKLRNDDDRWNPDNPTSQARYLMEQQEVKIRYGMDVGSNVEWIDGGTFWLTEWNTPSNGLEASFTAQDAIAFMTAYYTGPRVGTLYEIARTAFDSADLPLIGGDKVVCVIDESLKLVSTDFSADTSEYTIAEILQLVAHAGNCVFYQDRQGVVRIEPRNKTFSEYRIEPKISYAHPEYNMNKPLKSVSVSYGENLRESVTVDSKGEVQTVDNPLITTREQALAVAKNTRDVLVNRKVISGEFRADLRVDALDNIVVVSKYASNIIAVSEISYSTNSGAFRGKYVGRVVLAESESKDAYSGEFYLGEIF